MNIHQEHLLEILKEVDDFCRKHEITYYCAGGTVIGAARHRGFIPWDDDIDIYMTRSNFFKFAKTLSEYGPEDRVLEFYEANNEMQTTVPRYHKETTTMFCHYNLFGRSSAGTSMDVFILDPIPDSVEERRNYIAKLYAYSDLISPALTYSDRLPTEYYEVYEKYKKLAEKEGRARAVELISDEIFKYDESECSCYCLRWGSVPLIYPIDAIGKPIYLKFEDMEIPVPQDWYRYLTVHYGSDWIQVPYEEAQQEHLNILRYDMKYDYFYDKRDEVYSQDYLLDLHYRWKDSALRLQKQMDGINSFLEDTQNGICRANLEKNLANAGDSPADLVKEERYEEILELYKPYLELQTSNAYMGQRMRHGSQLRWTFPIVMPISEDEKEAIFTSLLHTGKVRMAEKLIGVFERADCVTEAVAKASTIVDTINTASKYYYYGNDEEAEKSILSIDNWKEIPSLSDIKWLCEAREGMSAERAAALENSVVNGDASDSQLKALGDYFWTEGEMARAEEVYVELMKTCRNGLFWMDIHDKGVDIAPIPTKRVTPFSDTELTGTQKQLLQEIAEICDRNDIRYILHPTLARRIYLTGNIGYFGNKREILMDAENALKFMAAFKKEMPEKRKLLSWADGDDIRDFALIYMDSENVFCDFRRLEQWRGMGIHITIRILRRKTGSKVYRKSIMYDEFCLNLLTMEAIEKKNLQSRKKKMAYAALHAMPYKAKDHFKHRLFKRSVKNELQRTEGDFYYYTNLKGVKPQKHKLKKELWDKTVFVEADGVKYCIPEAMTASYISKEVELSSMKPIVSNFIYYSDKMSWDEILPIIDEDRYISLSWNDYAKSRKKYRSLTEKTARCWRMVLKEGEELELKENSAEIVKAYKAAAEIGDLDKITEVIRFTDATIKKYEAYDVPVYLENDLRKCYEDFLDRTKQKAFKKRMISLWDKNKSEYYNNA